MPPLYAGSAGRTRCRPRRPATGAGSGSGGASPRSAERNVVEPDVVDPAFTTCADRHAIDRFRGALGADLLDHHAVDRTEVLVAVVMSNETDSSCQTSGATSSGASNTVWASAMKRKGLARRLRPTVIAEPSAMRSFSNVALVVRSCTLNARRASPCCTGRTGGHRERGLDVGRRLRAHALRRAAVTGVTPVASDHASSAPDSKPSAKTTTGSAMAAAESSTGAVAVELTEAAPYDTARAVMATANTGRARRRRVRVCFDMDLRSPPGGVGLEAVRSVATARARSSLATLHAD